MSDAAQLIIPKQARKTVVVELPSYPGSRVHLRTFITMEERRAITSKYPELKENDMLRHDDAQMDLLKSVVEDWNFGTEEKDDDGNQKKLPIDKDGFDQLSAFDVTLIIGFLGGVAEVKDGKLAFKSEELKKALT